jgi:hypothetical protein
MAAPANADETASRRMAAIFIIFIGSNLHFSPVEPFFINVLLHSLGKKVLDASPLLYPLADSVLELERRGNSRE